MRVARAERDLALLAREVEEGLHVARQYGLELSHVELLCERAEAVLESGDAATAQSIASDALHRAAAPACQFIWGAAPAGHILGQAAAAQGSMSFARSVLERTLATRRRIGDVRAHESERLLRQIC